MKVEQRRVDAAGMVTIGPDHPAWKNPLKMGEVEGLFVRLDPPLNCPDIDVVRMRVQAEELGAVAIKVLKVRRNELIATKEVVEAPRYAAREVVMRMVKESRSKHRDVLEDVVEQALRAAGL